MFTEIIHNGERMIVNDPSAYEGCEIVCEHDDMPRDVEEAMVSNDHIEKMHTLKALEAAMIVSGNNLEAGILAEEADALGLDLLELAQTVLENARTQRALEIRRRFFKRNNP